MLDVHPPHRPAMNLKEFFLHLVTITVGLLIALGIERIADWRHHVNQVAEARAMLHDEIERNVKDIDEAIQTIQQERKDMEANLEAMSAIQSSKKGFTSGHISLKAVISPTTLRVTSWRTAQQTGVLAYMPYDEAQLFTEIYMWQEKFDKAQNVLSDDVAQVNGLLRKTNFLKAGSLTPEHASDFAERFGAWYTHLVLLQAMARGSAEFGHAYLEGREPNADISDVSSVNVKKEKH
jgi:hypothetical protein